MLSTSIQQNDAEYGIFIGSDIYCMCKQTFKDKLDIMAQRWMALYRAMYVDLDNTVDLFKFAYKGC